MEFTLCWNYFFVCWDWSGDCRFDLWIVLCTGGLRWEFKLYVEIHAVYARVCALGCRLDIYVGNCFRMMDVAWGLDTYLGN